MAEKFVQRESVRIPRQRSSSGADVAAAALVPVEIVEVGDHDGHRQGDCEDSCNDAERSNQLAEDADRRDVAVADGRHGDDRPPERARDRCELTVLLAGLGVVRRRAEDDHGDQQEEEEHSELMKARLDRHTEDPQALPSSHTDIHFPGPWKLLEWKKQNSLPPLLSPLFHSVPFPLRPLLFPSLFHLFFP